MYAILSYGKKPDFRGVKGGPAAPQEHSKSNSRSPTFSLYVTSYRSVIHNQALSVTLSKISGHLCLKPPFLGVC